MKTIIYIASLAHSGSTLLDLVLGGHPHFIGLGEETKVLDSSPIELKKHVRQYVRVEVKLMIVLSGEK